MKKKQPERQQKMAFIELMQYKLPTLYKYLFALEHGGSRHLLEAVNLKRIGVKAGLPDYFFMHPNLICHGLFIEFKANHNSLTSSQKDFFELAKDRGYKAIIVKSAEEATNKIYDYLDNKI